MLAGKFCNDIFFTFEKNPSSSVRILWRQIKPFIRGKIPYAPNTPVVQRIIKQVSCIMFCKLIILLIMQYIVDSVLFDM